jgi:hypothetical protein
MRSVLFYDDLNLQREVLRIRGYWPLKFVGEVWVSAGKIGQSFYA